MRIQPLRFASAPALRAEGLWFAGRKLFPNEGVAEVSVMPRHDHSTHSESLLGWTLSGLATLSFWRGIVALFFIFLASCTIPCDPASFSPRCEEEGALTCKDGREKLVACDGVCDERFGFCVVCGDVITSPGEECDDGNQNDNDFCRRDCTFSTPSTNCGNLVVDPGEDCDRGKFCDGAADIIPCFSDQECVGDGFGNGHCLPADNEDCSAQCQFLPAVCGNNIIEHGEDCEFDPTGRCTPACHFAACGDGFVSDHIDLNLNGVIDPGELGLQEGCDDGDTVGGDGCSSACDLEICGNGIVDPGEGCDDGDFNDFDGCTLLCQTACGNGVIEGNEECDQGIRNDGTPDACRRDCTLPVCGDQVTDNLSGEECDNPDASLCTLGCTLPNCGDGDVDALEGCDDGNQASGDGCDVHCQSEPRCGNGVIEPLEGSCYQELLLPSPGSFGGAGDTAVLSDVNLDGAVDIVIDTGVLLGNGDGSFQGIRGFGLQLHAPQAADLNGDAFPDLVVDNAVLPGNVVVGAVLVGNGDGTFLPPRIIPNLFTRTLVDVNADGKIDILAVENTGGLDILLNNGDATFQNPIQTPDLFANGFEKLTNDGLVDAVSLRFDFTLGHSVLEVFQGDGLGGFVLFRTFDAPSGIVSDLDFADLNQDGFLDIIMTNIAENSIDVTTTFFFNDGTGQLLTSNSVSALNHRVFTIADMNQDGTLELVGLSDDRSSFSIFSVDFSTGLLLGTETINIIDPTSNNSLLVGDFDGVNRLDIAIPLSPEVVNGFNFGPPRMSVYLHKP